MSRTWVAVVLLLLGGCSQQVSARPSGCASAASRPAPPAAVRVVATGLCAPWGLAFLPDGTALVTERDTARILSVSAGGRVAEVQRLSEPRHRGEGGLLGIAVSPGYATDRLVYIYYTTGADNRIARLRLGQPPEPILTGIPAADHHNGGRIAFGPDGLLYAGTGDAGRPAGAQDAGYLGGKILRLTPDGRPAPGNPVAGSPVWSSGHRNVQGLAWDARGRLFASEFGQDLYDELNLIEPGGNYGWPFAEGPAHLPRFADPVAAWTPTRTASPSGIAIAGDRAYLACLAGQRLIRVGLDGTGEETLLAGTFGRLRDVAPAPDGTLWLLTSNRDGRGTPTPADDQILSIYE